MNGFAVHSPTDNFESLVGHFRSRLEVGRLAELAETPIQFRIAQSDAQDGAAAGQMIDRQDFARQLPWPTLRQRRHQRSEPQVHMALFSHPPSPVSQQIQPDPARSKCITHIEAVDVAPPVIVAVNAWMMVSLDSARVLLRQVDNGLTTILAMNFNDVLCNF